MGDSTQMRRTDRLGVFPQRARLEVVRPRLPFLLARGEHGLRDFELDRAFFRVDRDDVAILDERINALVVSCGEVDARRIAERRGKRRRRT